MPSKGLKEEPVKGIAVERNIIFGGIAVVLVIALLWYIEDSKPGEYDDFAKCIADANATFYGTKTCPHCNEQKEMFGKSVSLLPYVECSLPAGMGQAQACNDAGIRAYPTWVFSDGSRELGRLSFEVLSQKTGCGLPA